MSGKRTNRGRNGHGRALALILAVCMVFVFGVSSAHADDQSDSNTGKAYAAEDSGTDTSGISTVDASSASETEVPDSSGTSAENGASQDAETTPDADNTDTGSEDAAENGEINSAEIVVPEESSSDEGQTEDSSGWEDGLIEAKVSYTVKNTADVYRLYNPNSGEHFYTTSYQERDNALKAGWRYEGIGWTSPLKGVNGSVPVYRLYNPNAGNHHYTLEVSERDYLTGLGWRYEGIGWYSDSLQNIPLYREYNPNSGLHNFTTSRAEDQMLKSEGWTQEGVAWYGVEDPDPTITHPVTIYGGIDFSAIYDFNYYLNNNPSVRSKYGNYNDEAVLEDFVKNALKAKRPGKASYSQTVYNQIREAVYPTPKPTPAPVVISDAMDRKAQGYSSATSYEILVNRSTHLVSIYKGYQGHWQRIHRYSCGDGKASTPTVEGVFSVINRKPSFGSSSYTCWYATRFYGGYLFHSVLYYPGSKTRIKDGRLGMGVSHGCVRLAINNAKWIYENIPNGTRVVVYH